jgi:sRNA-binding regulator protein Hfq
MKELTKQIDEKESLGIVSLISKADVEEKRELFRNLEITMLREEQVEIPVKHAFSGGMYSREIVIPKGTLLTGRIHKFDHFDVMISGDISVSTDNEEPKRLTGYHSFEGKAGKKRVGYAHEDTHWITFHSSPENNPDDMYHFLTCSTFEELEQFNIDMGARMAQFDEDEQKLINHANSILKEDEV